MNWFDIRCGDALTLLQAMPDESVQCVVTSPPYWGLRDYQTASWDGGAADCDHLMTRGGQGKTGQRADRAHTQRVPYKDICGRCGASRQDLQLGLEETPTEYVAKVVEIFQAVRRVLAKDGTCWVNLGDTYCNSDKWGGGGVNTGKHTKAPDGSVPSWSGVRRKWATIPGLKPKDLVGIPWMVAFALRDAGWYLRSDIVWHKPNPMPESVTDRPTKSHEYLFLFAKSERYYYDVDAIREPVAIDSIARYERGRSDDHKWADGGPGNQTIAKSFEHMRDRTPAGWHQGSRPATPSGILDKRHARNSEEFRGTPMRSSDPETLGLTRGRTNESCTHPNGRNKRSVWTISTQPFPEAHFATFPEELVRPCILAGSRIGDTVLDPFAGSGTTGAVAIGLQRNFIGLELNPEYCDMAKRRIYAVAPLFSELTTIAGGAA